MKQDPINEELRLLKSPLAEASRGTPYIVPEGYFEELHARISRAAIESEPIAILPKSTPYDVPPRFFKELPHLALASVQTADRPSKRPYAIPLWSQVRLAAAAIVLLCIGFGVMKSSTPPTPEQQLSEIPEAVIAEYVRDRLDEFEVELLESYTTPFSGVPTWPQSFTDKMN